jgi:rhamnogalacturonan endolyase
MKNRTWIVGRSFSVLAVVVGALSSGSARGEGTAAIGELPAVAKPTVSTPVTVTDEGGAWVMDNGIAKATIDKRTSHITSMIYHGVNIMGPGGIWEQTPSGDVKYSVTIDPSKNGGERGEVALKGVNGKMDIEVRYAMERGVSGIYTYAEFSHAASYPAAGEGESRFILQMNPTFDWLSVDADRNMLMCSNADERAGVVVHAKEQRILSTGIYKNSVEHKYSYCAEMYKLPAYGWSSTRNHIGVYFINPSTEYIGGGAAKLDLVCHMGATLLDYWTSGHYAGGACCSIPAGENWKKVVGPIFVYCNALAEPKDPSKAELDTLRATEGNPTIPATWRNNSTALWYDALAMAKPVKAAWPYEWVKGVDYPHRAERGTVTGQLVLHDSQAATTKLPHLTVGLAHPDYVGVGGAFAERSGNGNLVTWEHEGNYYQFWVDGAEDGKFAIENVRPGTYTLHAFADGVLGEYAQANITVKAGKAVDLGALNWEPVRFGKQVWEIGYPTRAGTSSSRGMVRTTGCGGGACDIRCCSRTTSRTRLGRATTGRTGSSSRCRTGSRRRG